MSVLSTQRAIGAYQASQSAATGGGFPPNRLLRGAGELLAKPAPRRDIPWKLFAVAAGATLVALGLLALYLIGDVDS